MYDIHRLIQSGVALPEIVAYLPEKFRHRGVDLDSLSAALLEERRSEYEQSWHKQLDYLIPDSDAITFEDAWKSTIEAVQRIEALIRKP